jgi:hypothetical protein
MSDEESRLYPALSPGNAGRCRVSDRQRAPIVDQRVPDGAEKPGFRSFPVEPAPVRRRPLPSPSGAPTPSPAPEGGEVLSAGRARGLAARGRNQPQALERISVSDAVKGSLRRATPALDSALNAHDAASLVGVCAGGHRAAGARSTRNDIEPKTWQWYRRNPAAIPRGF